MFTNRKRVKVEIDVFSKHTGDNELFYLKELKKHLKMFFGVLTQSIEK